MTNNYFGLFILISVTIIHYISGEAIIGNGHVILGVDDFGQLNIDYVGGVLGLPATDPVSVDQVGLRNGDGDVGNYSATEYGCDCEGWGVALVNTAGNVQVYANNAKGSSATLVSFSGTNGDDSAISRVRDTGSTPNVEVVHNFHPSASDYAMQLDVTIINIGTNDYDQTLYRRMMDWDIDPTPTDEYVTVIGTNSTSKLILSNDNGFCTKTPLEPCAEIQSGTTNVDFYDNGPADHGGNFDFDFGPLAAGEQVEFTIFYGAAQGEDLALQSLGEIQAELASLAQPETSRGLDGFPYTFFFAFKGVGGEVLQTESPTTETRPPSPSPAEGNCTEQDIGSFNWETLVGHGTAIPDFDVVEFNVSEENLTLDIVVELEYLGSVMGDNHDDEANYGVTYVLDFEDYNAHKDLINQPGSCQNRDGDSFMDTTLSFQDYWNYSTQPIVDGVGTNDYLAYPPPGTDWSIYMKPGDECSTIVYEGHFAWNDLVSCQSYDGSIDYITTTDGEDEITLDGVFYINVVSPFVSNEETGYYRVYQLLSQPFTIAIGKSVFVMGSTGINVLSMTMISVYKEDGANTFRLIALTESYEYLKLGRDTTSLYIFNPSDGASIATGDFTAPTEAVSVDEGCLNNKEFLCSQLWEISAENVDCRNGNDKGIDFSGDYTLKFVPECRSVDDIGSDLNTYCTGWLSSHSDIADGVDLLASLTWKDEVCDPLLFEMQFEASMNFYIDDEFNISAASDQLYQAGEDTIYVEIDTSFPSDTYSVFDTELINVWICTFDPLEGPQEPIDPNTASGGCFSANRDGGNQTDDNPYFYHIYSSDGPIEEEGFDLVGHPDGDNSKIQFSFVVPGKIRRDTLYIHSQIEVTLSDESEVSARRLLANPSTTNQMDHFLGNIGINRNNKPNTPPQQEPNNDYKFNDYNYNPPQQFPFHPPSATTTTWTFSLSSSWIIGIGSILGLILFGNILYLFYMNCLDKRQRARVSFNHRRRSGYDSVKNVDSEDVYDSEAALIDQEQRPEAE